MSAIDDVRPPGVVLMPMRVVPMKPAPLVCVVMAPEDVVPAPMRVMVVKVVSAVMPQNAAVMSLLTMPL